MCNDHYSSAQLMGSGMTKNEQVKNPTWRCGTSKSEGYFELARHRTLIAFKSGQNHQGWRLNLSCIEYACQQF